MFRTLSSFQATQVFVARAILEVMEIEPHLYIYRQVVVGKATDEADAMGFAPATMAMPATTLPKSITSGIVDEVGLNNLKQGKAPEHKKLTIVTDRQKEILRTQGWPAAQDDIHKDFPKDPWALFSVNEGLTADNLVNLDVSSHMTCDRHGQVLPAALTFDYISSGINETSYDLEALAAHLLTREDVDVYSGKGGDRANPGIAKSAKDAIFQIPYYNEEEGQTLSVQFLWKPAAEDYHAVWAQCKGEYPSTQMRRVLLDLDLLGIKAFSRAPETKVSRKPR